MTSRNNKKDTRERAIDRRVSLTEYEDNDIDIEETAKNTEYQKGSTPTAKYGVLFQKMRHAIPESYACSIGCGGEKCKYCNAPASGKFSEEHMQIKGLFSSWITDKIIAISRPSTTLVERYDIIGQFEQKNIKSIINLQLPGEHPACGLNKLEVEGFSYKPEDFMKKKIFFYNFGWRDYGVGTTSGVLDTVKVMQYSISEGAVAVHCHAGSGRTGVLIACYFIYANRMTAEEAIHLVRSKRPGSIQTVYQVKFIQEFQQYIRPFKIVYSLQNDCDGNEAPPFNLSQYIVRQRYLLHGQQFRTFKYLPKIVYIICERLLTLNKEMDRDYNPAMRQADKRDRFVKDGKRWKGKKTEKLDKYYSKHQDSSSIGSENNDNDDEAAQESISLQVIEALELDDYDGYVHKRVEELKQKLNAEINIWKTLGKEENAVVLAKLLWDWIEELHDPVLRAQDFQKMLLLYDHPYEGLASLDSCSTATVVYLFRFLSALGPLNESDTLNLIEKFLSCLTQRNIVNCDSTMSSTSTDFRPRATNFSISIKDGISERLLKFFKNLLGALSEDDRNHIKTTNKMKKLLFSLPKPGEELESHSLNTTNSYKKNSTKIQSSRQGRGGSNKYNYEEEEDENEDEVEFRSTSRQHKFR
ncbi:DgyrCDS323 [Dimorphilus gyrociliatus]|uniref:DgyrCDS323 n=1 Tax=Dimorphilus gyrociliatus TaxID=2664684 RepID=A0A7I8V5G8_9ANNE|nr:DgyrCDS323 [Dimorphilus gyrociliatus]